MQFLYFVDSYSFMLISLNFLVQAKAFSEQTKFKGGVSKIDPHACILGLFEREFTKKLSEL